MRKIDVNSVRNEILERVNELKAKGTDSEWAKVVYSNCNRIFEDAKKLEDADIECYPQNSLEAMMRSGSPLSDAYELEKCGQLLDFLIDPKAIAICEEIPMLGDWECDHVWILSEDESQICGTCFMSLLLSIPEPIKPYSYPPSKEFPYEIPDRILKFFKENK